MVSTYSGNPNSSDIDTVRFEVGDTKSKFLLSDEEIQFAVDQEATLLGAAARCCEVLARRFSRDADVELGPQRIKASQRASAFAARAKELRGKTAAMNAPYAGNMSKSDEQLDKLNTNLKQPKFKIDIMSQPGDSGNIFGR